MNYKYDKAWASQDLAMAETIKSYGFTAIYRASEHKLLAAFDNGTFCYEIPWICFLFVQPGETVNIDSLIKQCEVNL
jgi:hypothetical protein